MNKGFACALTLLGTLVFAAGAARAQGVPDEMVDPRPPADLRDALAPVDGRLGGRLEATIDGETFALPTLQTDVHADIAGDLASVSVVQSFANPTDRPMNATYVFPLDEQAAVFEMVMMVGDQVVRAEIREIEEARRTFEAAKRAGKSAALLCEHRPNLFTQEIANLMPDLPVTVTLRYVQPVRRIDDSYELVVPLVVGPRYVPPSFGEAVPADVAEPRVDLVSGEDESASEGGGLDALPEQAPVFGLHVPEAVDGRRLSISAYLDGGMPVASVASATHPIVVTEVSRNERRIELAEGRTFDNRDFVLRYELAGAAVGAGVLASHDERGGFFSVLIEPPAAIEDTDVTPREMVFVLDCSGSMAGLPIAASKAFMRRALENLRPTDSFRIIRFSDAATEFSARPLSASPDHVRRALAYVDQLNGEGGTMMTSGIRQAFLPPALPGAVRVVVFLTDGYIGNEHEVLRLITDVQGDARLFAFGVGTAVNRFLLSQIGRIGRGFTRYMDPTEKVDEVAAELAERLQSPVLTDIEIDWGSLAPTEVFPARVPDLFAGHSVRIAGRFENPGTYEIAVRGQINGQAARLPLTLELDQPGHGAAVGLTWARAAIADAMEELTFPVEARGEKASDEQIKERVTDLGLEFSLVTRWTAFVAVAEAVVNTSPASTIDTLVPVPMVEGVTPLAYPQHASVAAAPAPPAYSGAVNGSGSGGTGFSGSASPEPATMTGLLVSAGAGIAALRRRRRRASI